MKIAYTISLIALITLSSCHFYDDRVVVKNKSEEEVLFAISNVSPNNRDDILSPFYKLKPNKKRCISLLKNLNYGFMDIDSVSILQITPQIEKNVLEENGYYAYERILNDKSYTYLNVSTKDIVESGKLLILYTSESFKKAE